MQLALVYWVGRSVRYGRYRTVIPCVIVMSQASIVVSTPIKLYEPDAHRRPSYPPTQSMHSHKHANFYRQLSSLAGFSTTTTTTNYVVLEQTVGAWSGKRFSGQDCNKSDYQSGSIGGADSMRLAQYTHRPESLNTDGTNR